MKGKGTINSVPVPYHCMSCCSWCVCLYTVFLLNPFLVLNLRSKLFSPYPSRIFKYLGKKYFPTSDAIIEHYKLYLIPNFNQKIFFLISFQHFVTFTTFTGGLQSLQMYLRCFCFGVFFITNFFIYFQHTYK